MIAQLLTLVVRPNVLLVIVTVLVPDRVPFLALLKLVAAALIGMLEPDLSETDRMAEGYKLGDRLARGEVPLDAVIAPLVKQDAPGCAAAILSIAAS